MNRRENRRRGSIAWTLIVGLTVEALFMGSWGVLNILWSRAFARFDGESPLVPTIQWISLTALVCAALVWGLFGALTSRLSEGLKAWQRLGIVVTVILNTLGLVLLSFGLLAGPKFESIDYLQIAFVMVLMAFMVTAGLLLLRQLRHLKPD